MGYILEFLVNLFSLKVIFVRVFYHSACDQIIAAFKDIPTITQSFPNSLSKQISYCIYDMQVNHLFRWVTKHNVHTHMHRNQSNNSIIQDKLENLEVKGLINYDKILQK